MLGRLRATPVQRRDQLHRSVPREDRGVGRRQPRPGPRRRRPAQARGDGLRGLGAHDAASGGRGQGDVSSRAPAALSAVAARARAVVPVGLRRRAAGGGAEDVVVVRLAGLEPLPRGAADARQDAADGDRLHRHDAAPVRRRADVRLERQREDAHAGPHRAHRGAPPDDGRGRPAITA